ncbi:MAG: glutamate synthase [Acidobacteriota bacterium]|nr:glutamate synthase [Acidobacteriota bacterium]MDH3525314.1 glutamate synthase [Acidobacteriota bacterium]
MFEELESSGSIFHLPAARFVRGTGDLDLSTAFHGHRAGSPLGPAAGPQSQMAQNLVLSWLGGCRVMELKTVQVLDELHVPRPCIDVRTVGLNAEWSQELKLEESLDEYVKGAMLIEMLRSGPVAPAAGFGETVFDMSVGYDLHGIRSRRVLDFIAGMLDCGAAVERFRRQIPDRFRHLRDLDFPTRLSDTITLSTFHGCPPDEIEKIMDFLMRELGVHAIVKFNPMLLGPEEAGHLLHDVLGYTDLRMPGSAFERDTTWEQATAMVERLGATAAELGVGFGVKFSNTMIVENGGGFLAPGVGEVYLSGQPLHVMAIQLVRRFRRAFGDRFPISFAAGVDRRNFPDAAALGLVPTTVCTDLLRKGGYGRLAGYYAELATRMAGASASDLDALVLGAYGNAGRALESLGLDGGDPALARCRAALAEGGDLRAAAEDELFARWVSATKLLNTETYADRVLADPRYTASGVGSPPRKIGSHLETFDCVTCDICVPVCPNDANFTLGSEQREIEVAKVTFDAETGAWHWWRGEPLRLEQRHQIGNFVDFCNDCGNCDVFCPEDGGPYVMKPRFFGREDDWRQERHLDGFFLASGDGGDRMLGRLGGRELELLAADGGLVFSSTDFRVAFDPAAPEATLEGEARGEVDLTYCNIMDYFRRAILRSSSPTWVSTLAQAAGTRGDPRRSQP